MGLFIIIYSLCANDKSLDLPWTLFRTELMSSGITYLLGDTKVLSESQSSVCVALK